MGCLCHTPHGVCGLKLCVSDHCPACVKSHPAWGVWIETGINSTNTISITSHPAWGVWIETFEYVEGVATKESHPAWGVWIETCIIRVSDTY